MQFVSMPSRCSYDTNYQYPAAPGTGTRSNGDIVVHNVRPSSRRVPHLLKDSEYVVQSPLNVDPPGTGRDRTGRDEDDEQKNEYSKLGNHNCEKKSTSAFPRGLLEHFNI